MALVHAGGPQMLWSQGTFTPLKIIKDVKENLFRWVTQIDRQTDKTDIYCIRH